MRTNIEIDDQLMADAMQFSNAKTKRETIDQALREFVRYRKRAELARSLQGKVDWIGDLEAMRLDNAA